MVTAHFFLAADDNEKLWMSYFLNTGCREQEVANTEYCDLLDDVNVVWVFPAPPWLQTQR